jgi:hypothetical protein
MATALRVMSLSKHSSFGHILAGADHHWCHVSSTVNSLGVGFAAFEKFSDIAFGDEHEYHVLWQ